jgi:hypothetical protein
VKGFPVWRGSYPAVILGKIFFIIAVIQGGSGLASTVIEHVLLLACAVVTEYSSTEL